MDFLREKNYNVTVVIDRPKQWCAEQSWSVFKDRGNGLQHRPAAFRSTKLCVSAFGHVTIVWYRNLGNHLNPPIINVAWVARQPSGV